ncbi:hypothetical protein HpMMM27_08300 [Helicobacter pylori]
MILESMLEVKAFSVFKAVLIYYAVRLFAKVKEYEGFFNEFNASMRTNEQEVTSVLNAN